MKKFIKSTLGQKILSYFVFLYMQFVYKTSQWDFINKDVLDEALASKRPIILCSWHQRLFMMPFIKKWQIPTYALLSSHTDGIFAAKVLRFFKIDVVYGSSTRGGDRAALSIIRLLKKNNIIGITPDGPKGPEKIANPGIAHLALLSNALVLPLCYSIKKKKNLRSWDHFLFPLPFSKGHFYCEEIIDATCFKTVEDLRSKIEDQLNSVTNSSDNLL